MKKHFFYIAILASMAVACSEDTDLPVPDSGLQKDPAAVLAEDFFLSVQPSKTRGSVPKFTVDAIERQMYHAVGDTVLPVEVTRAATDDSLAFEIQTITFHTGDQQGYAVVSDDERLKTVYYFTEVGQLSDTADIAPLKEFIDSIPLFAQGDILNPMLQSSISTDYMYVPGLISYTWGQHSPYNWYGRYCNCSKCSQEDRAYHNPIGCITTATAEVIACCGKFRGTYYGNKDIDFTRLRKSTEQFLEGRNIEDAKLVASFFHEVALGCQIKFDCDGSASHPKAIYNYLRDMGYDCTYAEGNLDINRFINNLSNGYPHIICGKKNLREGHAWVIDGVHILNGNISFRMVWGNDGHSDGWSKANPYTKPMTSTQFSRDLKHVYINSIYL